jgi:DNA polymerase, archaea type
MAKFKFYPLDIDYEMENNTPFILLFGRIPGGTRICVKVKFFPYVWVLYSNEDEKTRVLNKLNSLDEVDTVGVEEDSKIVDRKEELILKVTLQTPDQVPKLRNILTDEGISFLEADIPFVRRYLIDHEIIMFQEYVVEGNETKPFAHTKCVLATKIEQGETSYDETSNILAFDIETYPDETQSTDNAILMISFASRNYKKVITWKSVDPREDYVEIVDGEAELIERFKQIIDDQEPDIITGYFSDNFDLPYLNERAKKYNIKVDIGLDNSQLKFGRGMKEEVAIRGTLHIDTFNFNKNILKQSIKGSRSLGNVAKELLNDTKKDINILDLGPAWDNHNKKNLAQFCEYCLHDSVLALELCIKLLPNLVEMVKIIGLPAFDVSRLSLSQMVEWFLIKNTGKHNNLVPNKPNHEEVRERNANILKGAFVFEPQPGLYKNILLFDFRSLYPTIIATHNLSGATFRCKCCTESATKVPMPKEFDEKGEGFWFCQKRTGFLPAMIEELITRRKRVKDIMKEKHTPFLDARQNTLKLLANSFYGYLAFNPSRWYSFEAANSTTAFARHYINQVIDAMTNEKLQVIYGDTDSVFVVVKNDAERKKALGMVGIINKTLPGIMELEFEGNYPSGIFVGVKEGVGGAKKRYALIDDKDNLVIKGFETVRRNTSTIAKEVQKKVLAIVLKENNPQKAFDYVKETMRNIRDSKLEVNNFVIKTQLTKEISRYDAIGPHVQIAKQMEEAGKRVLPGSIISYVICKGSGRVRDRAKIPGDAKPDEIDADYYIQKQILPVVDKIFEVLGFRVEELLEDKTQSKLGGFF